LTNNERRNLKMNEEINKKQTRIFLCGEDRFTGKSYEHRSGWVEEKLLSLGKVFCIDVCEYAVMSNQQNVRNI